MKTAKGSSSDQLDIQANPQEVIHPRPETADGMEEDQSGFPPADAGGWNGNPALRSYRGTRPFLIPCEAGHLAVKPEEILYFFTPAAVHQGFVHAGWSLRWCGRGRVVHARLMDGRVLETGHGQLSDAAKKFDGLLVGLNQSVLVRADAAQLLALKQGHSHIEVQDQHGETDCLCVSRRYKTAVKAAFGLGRKRRGGGAAFAAGA